MKNLIKNFIGNNGFTLIEAIISIAIVGIIVTPLSFMFSKSLNDSIEAREKLTTTQIAQQFIENIKAKPESEFMSFFGNTGELIGKETINSSTPNLSGFGFPDIPLGYSVAISYDKNTFTDTDDSYIVPNSTSTVNTPDFIINFYNSNNYTFSLENTGAATPTIYDLSTGTDTGERILHIYYNTDKSIEIKDGTSENYQEIKNAGSSLDLKNFGYSFSIKCKGTELNEIIPVKIYIHNEIPNHIVTAYVYKDVASTVDISINDNPTLCEGMTVIKYNMKDSNSNDVSHKIYSISVSVSGPLGITSDITATKIDE